MRHETFVRLGFGALYAVIGIGAYAILSYLGHSSEPSLEASFLVLPLSTVITAAGICYEIIDGKSRGQSRIGFLVQSWGFYLVGWLCAYFAGALILIGYESQSYDIQRRISIQEMNFWGGNAFVATMCMVQIFMGSMIAAMLTEEPRKKPAQR